MRKALRFSFKRVRRVTPGKRNIFFFRKSKTSKHICGGCGTKLNRVSFRQTKMRNTAKTKKRPERPFPELCSKCMREELKARVRL